MEVIESFQRFAPCLLYYPVPFKNCRNNFLQEVWNWNILSSFNNTLTVSKRIYDTYSDHAYSGILLRVV